MKKANNEKTKRQSRSAAGLMQADAIALLPKVITLCLLSTKHKQDRAMVAEIGTNDVPATSAGCRCRLPSSLNLDNSTWCGYNSWEKTTTIQFVYREDTQDSARVFEIVFFSLNALFRTAVVWVMSEALCVSHTPIHGWWLHNFRLPETLHGWNYRGFK